MCIGNPCISIRSSVPGMSILYAPDVGGAG